MDSALLSLTYAGLGAAEEDEGGGAVGYVKGEHCLDNLKDLQRLLRRDDPERREVFKQVCKWRIASRDLVPIIENYQADRNLVITAGKFWKYSGVGCQMYSGTASLDVGRARVSCSPACCSTAPRSSP